MEKLSDEERKKRQSASQKAYRNKNKEKLRADNKAYRNENKEKEQARQKAYQSKNRGKRLVYQKAYYNKNKERLLLKDRDRVLRRKYRITMADYHATYQQQKGRCAICGTPGESCTNPDAERLAILHVDHCHATGKTRGLLCNRCNWALGIIRDNAEVADRMAAYIRQYALGVK